MSVFKYVAAPVVAAGVVSVGLTGLKALERANLKAMEAKIAKDGKDQGLTDEEIHRRMEGAGFGFGWGSLQGMVTGLGALAIGGLAGAIAGKIITGD